LGYKHVATTTTVASVNIANDNGREGYMRLRDNVNLERNSTVEGVQAGEGYQEEMQRNYTLVVLCKVFLFVLFVSHVCFGGMEEEEGVKYANRCEGKCIVTYIIQLSDCRDVSEIG
jgi:hypothetical protein